jgi:DNA primase
MSTWVDFKEVKDRLSFKDLLAFYNARLKTKGDKATGFCPLPTHKGKGRSPSFSVNLTQKIWQCFGCGAKGNILDFAVRMEGLDPATPADVRKTALMLQERFTHSGERPAAPSKPEVPASSTLPVIVNAPLDFTLKELDPTHPYLAERGFEKKTISHFGLGFCNRGLLKARIAIPLHNQDAKLIGYAGRLTNDEDISEEHPKYLFPPRRERDGKLYEFRKSLFLYNGFRIREPVARLIVVEGFPAVWCETPSERRNVLLLQRRCEAPSVPTVGKGVGTPDVVTPRPDCP